MRAAALPVATAVLLIAGCSTGAAGPQTGESTKTPAAKPQAYVRKGLCNSGGSDIPLRLEIIGIERAAKHTRLRLAISLDGVEKHHDMHFFGMSNFEKFKLIDPVGRRLYRMKSGHRLNQFGWYYKDIRYETEIYYDAIPESARKLTVITPCSFGEMSGIPVTNGELPYKPTPKPTTTFGDDKAGTRVDLTADPPEAGAAPNYSDLYAVEEGKQEKSTGTDEETIALRTDVLFAFDKAKLSDKAQAVLDEVAEETRRRADPAKPPVIITGHTDSKGDESYNMRLSVRRAQAVQKYLATKLGTDYKYRSEGKGETRPIAEEGGAGDAKARAKNRRVDVSYKIKQAVETTATPGAPTAPPAAGTAPAADFQADPGKMIAERKSEDGWRLRVYQPYRDGAFMVGVYDVTNETGGWEFNMSPRYDGDQPGSMWGGLVWVDPASGRKQRVVRVGKFGQTPDGYNYAAHPVIIGHQNQAWREHVAYRIYAYYAAPPAGAKSLTLDTDRYGKVPDVPVR